MSLSSPRPPAWASMMAVATGVPGGSFSSPPAPSLSPAPTAIPGGSTVVPMRVNSSSARSPKPICLQNEGSQPCTISLPALRHTHTQGVDQIKQQHRITVCMLWPIHPPSTKVSHSQLYAKVAECLVQSVGIWAAVNNGYFLCWRSCYNCSYGCCLLPTVQLWLQCYHFHFKK